MNCDNCGAEDAVIHIRQIIGSDIKDLHLCPSCAAEKGILGNTEGKEFSLPELLNGLVDGIPGKGEKEAESCPSCGMKRDDLDKEGRIGCPDCVNAFRKELRRSLKKRGVSSLHTGKLPVGLKTVKTLLFDKEMLKNKLKKAIEAEEYERAAELRDRIRAIEESAGVSHES